MRLSPEEIVYDNVAISKRRTLNSVTNVNHLVTAVWSNAIHLEDEDGKSAAIVVDFV